MTYTAAGTGTGHIQGRMLAESSAEHQAAVLDAWLSRIMAPGPISGPLALRRTGLALRPTGCGWPRGGPGCGGALAVLSDVVANTAGDVDA